MKIQKNTQYTIDITDTTAKGFGVGYIDGMAVFVDGALTGDTVNIHIVKSKTRYAFGKIIDIIKKSPDRIDSPCAVSARCGGCQFMHATYEAQLKIKHNTVVNALARIGGVAEPNVAPILGMEQPFRYRNKAVFPIVPADNVQGFAIGMFAPRSHRIVEVHDCLIQHEAHVKILSALTKYLQSQQVLPYDETTHTGVMRHVTIRTSQATNEVMVVLTVNANGLPDEDFLTGRLTASGATTIVISVNKQKNNNIMGDDFRTVYGDGYITESIGDIKYQISAPSFFQVNPVQTKVLYDEALRQANVQGGIVIDAHVGAGGVLLHAAKNADQIIGVDIVDAAIDNANENAALNGIDNAVFIAGSAETVIPKMIGGISTEEKISEDELSQYIIKPNAVFLDPPRKGCEPELLHALNAAKVPRIVYISCDPATLARDIKILSECYTLKEAVPVDMFPMTGKVETTCLLGLKED